MSFNRDILIKFTIFSYKFDAGKPLSPDKPLSPTKGEAPLEVRTGRLLVAGLFEFFEDSILDFVQQARGASDDDGAKV